MLVFNSKTTIVWDPLEHTLISVIVKSLWDIYAFLLAAERWQEMREESNRVWHVFVLFW